jgi:hypothetical protein
MNCIKAMAVVFTVVLSGCRTIVVPSSFAANSFIEPYEPGSIDLGSRVAATTAEISCTDGIHKPGTKQQDDAPSLA